VEVVIERGVIKTLKKYPENHWETIFNHIRKLEDPYRAPNVECLFATQQMYRMHVGRSYTLIFRILKEKDTVLVLELMTIEQAHKRYRRYQ
jgi:mRNA interferase RelE/StbE